MKQVRERFFLKSLFRLIGRYYALLVVMFLIFGMVIPDYFLWVMETVPGTELSALNCLLGFVMFGMGMTLSVNDFVIVLKHPKEIVIGMCAQFIIMPGLAFGIAKALALDPALTAGLVIVGTCPGGTVSNIITFMSKGDVALSVAVTSSSTAVSPILTPLLTYLLIGAEIAFSPLGMFWSIVQIVILPIALGLAVNRFWPGFANNAEDCLPAISGLALSFVIAGVMASSRDAIFITSGSIFIAVALLNGLGYILGFLAACLTGLSWKKSIAIAIEVGMQNAGLATALSKTHFAAMPAATVPGAVFTACHNLSGPLIAYIFENYLNPKYHPDYKNQK